LNNTQKSGGTSVWINSGVVSAVEKGLEKVLVLHTVQTEKTKALKGLERINNSKSLTFVLSPEREIDIRLSENKGIF